MSEIDQNELQAAIELIEEDGPLPNLTILYDAVIEALDIHISQATLKGHIQAWGILVKTKLHPKIKPATDQPIEHEDYPSGTRLLTVYTPRGDCPCKLKSTDRDTVDAWIHKVREIGMKNGSYYTSDALIYFVRHWYDLFTPEYKLVRSYIQSITKT